MPPRGFDKYFLRLGMGTHPKFARLTDSERCAHVFGVLAVAAASPVRGCLLIGELPAEAVDVAATAGVSKAVAASALRKLQAVGVLYPDPDRGCLVVHDWDDVNPPPKTDSTNAERQAKYRRRNAASNAEGNGGHNGNVTPGVTTPEVEVEVEETTTSSKQPSSLRSDAAEVFAYWQERCDHPTAKLSADRRGKIEARLREGYDAQQIRDAIDGARRAAFVNENGKRFDDIALICRSGSKLEDFIGRKSQDSTVVQFGRKQNAGDLIRRLRENEAS